MRWSLILSTFIVVQSGLSFFCAALAVPLSSDELERRAPAGAKAASRTYRKNSESHGYAYKFDSTGGVTREGLKPEDRKDYGKKMLMTPGTDADHVFEHQMLNNHLAKHGLQYDKLHPDLQKEVKGIINGPENMAPVPASVNRGKGQLVKQGLEGKDIAPKKTRDGYTLLSYGTAKKTAKRLDQAFKDHGHDFGDKTFHDTLRNTMDNAKILKPGEPSPAGSSDGSVKASPRRSPRIYAKTRPRVQFVPPRRSTRIAANAQ